MSADSDLVEPTECGYILKTSKISPGQKITCPDNDLEVEKTEANEIKLTLLKNGKITKA